jgi:hypothetical protein
MSETLVPLDQIPVQRRREVLPSGSSACRLADRGERRRIGWSPLPWRETVLEES